MLIAYVLFGGLVMFIFGYLTGREINATRTDRRIIDLERDAQYWREIAGRKPSPPWPPGSK